MSSRTTAFKEPAAHQVQSGRSVSKSKPLGALSLVGRVVSLNRAARGYSLAQLSQYTNIDAQTLCQLEAGQGDPCISDLMAIASALGIDGALLVEIGYPGQQAEI